MSARKLNPQYYRPYVNISSASVSLEIPSLLIYQVMQGKNSRYIVYIDVGLGVTGKHMCTKGSSMV
jgi:hypothetical protein